MAGGMLTKQAVLLTARFLNTVNDTVAGGTIFALPSGVQAPPYSQTLPGDRIVLDDASALALSDTVNTGTLFGGVYMYVGTLATSTAAPARGTIAFWRAAELPGGATQGYTVTADAQPTTSLPAYIAGVFINAITKGNFGWIQVAGVASVLFDTGLTATALAVTVSAKAGATTASTADAGVAISTVTLANVLGVAIGTPVISTISSVIITRGGTFLGRI
jgi:hypothetical protein